MGAIDFVLQLIVLGLVVWLVVWVVRGVGGRGGEARYCTTCGGQGIPRRVTRGSFAIEVLLWLCFILPGLLYSLWRLTTRTEVCASCGAGTLVPPDSPVAQKMRRELAQESAATKG